MTSNPHRPGGDVDGEPQPIQSPCATRDVPCPHLPDTDADDSTGKTTKEKYALGTRSGTGRGTRSGSRSATVTPVAVEPDDRSLEFACDLARPELTPGAARVLLRILREERDRRSATENGRPVCEDEALAS